MILKTLVSVFLTFMINVPHELFAAPSQIEARYAAAKFVHDLVKTLQSPMIPEEIKKTLLDGVRDEDKSYAKSLVVKWKPYTDETVYADFDQLVIRDENGQEVLRVRPPIDPSGEFSINGRNWISPTSGSIEKSLRDFLGSEKSDLAHRGRSRAKIIAMLFWGGSSSAQALKPEILRGQRDPIAPLYLFTTLTSSKAASAAGALAEKSPGAYLAKDDTFYSNFIGIFSEPPKTVACTTAGAKGTASVNGVGAAFEARPDGSVALQFSDSNKTRLLVSSRVIDDREAARDSLIEIDAYTVKDGSRDPEKAKKIYQRFFQKEKARGDNDEKYSAVATELRIQTERLFHSKNPNYVTALAPALKTLYKYYQSRIKPVITEELTIQQCGNPDCSMVKSGGPQSSISQWLPEIQNSTEKSALAWRASSGKKSPAKIVKFESTTSARYRLQDATKLDETDRKKAETLVALANNKAGQTERGLRNMALALRPLGECCGDSACREKLEKQDIKLEPNSRATKK